MNASLAAPGLHRHTVADYYRMAETGILPRDARVELIEGTIFDRAPIGISHASVVDRLGHLLTQATAGKAIVRVQNPVRLNTFSEPQPDLALLRWREDFYSGAHPGPEDILLIVEVADTSLRYDRTRKLPLYARAGIGEVWLIDLAGKCIERHLEPGADGYTAVTTIEGHVAPRGLPACEIDLAGLV